MLPTEAAGLATDSVTATARAVNRRERRAADVVADFLRRIQSHASELNCFITVLGSEAAATATALDETPKARGGAGPLAGVTVAVKDNIITPGIRTTCGSAVLRDWRPQRSAWVIDRLAASGAVLVGKSNMYEFAYGGVHPDFGDVSNPWRLDYGCCGSSSGSAAAVSAGLCHAAIGTDSGGSVRLPAAMCGVVGLKPTYGLLPMRGVVPLSESLDHLGVLARTVTDCQAVVAALVAPAASAGIDAGRIRVGVLDVFDEAIDGDVRTAYEQAVADVAGLGCSMRELGLGHLWSTVPTMWTIADVEGFTWHEPLLARAGEKYGSEARTRFEAGRMATAADYLHAQHVRGVWRRRLEAAFETVDVVMTPTAPRAWYAKRDRPRAGSGEAALEIGRYTALFNLTGHPAISVPCGRTADGFPVGVQFAGRQFADRELLAFAAGYQAATRHGGIPAPFS